MNSTYCPDCGTPNYYQLKKPNLCSNCGASFNSAFKVAPKQENKASIFEQRPIKKQKPVRVQYEDEDDEESYGEESFVAPKKLDLIIQVDDPNSRKVKMEDVLGSNEGNSSQRRDTAKVGKTSKAAQARRVQDWQQRASKTNRIDLSPNSDK